MTTNENITTEIVEDKSCNELSRDDIRIRRRDRRHEKKLETQSQNAKQQILDQDNAKAKLRNSDKLRIICNKDFQHYQNQATNNISEKTNLHVKHGKYFNTKNIKEFNLLDFANKINHRRIQSKQNIKKRIYPNHYSGRFQHNLKSGKRREGAIKKTKSKLKKLVLKNRAMKRTHLENTNLQSDSLCLKDAEDVQTDNVENMEALNKTKNTDLQTTSLEIEALNLKVEKLILEKSSSNDQISIVSSKTESQSPEESNHPKQKDQLNHSRRFREYCDNFTTPDLCKLTEDFIRELFRFQKRAYEKNQIKARAHKRYVFGFRETRNNLLANKLKLVIIAPDIEPCNIDGGLDDTINELKLICNENNIPYVFSLKKRQLAYCCFKKSPISCMGILFYDGAQDMHFKLIECLNMEKAAYLKSHS